MRIKDGFLSERNETEKDRVKRAIMETMEPLLGDDEIVVVDPDAALQHLKAAWNEIAKPILFNGEMVRANLTDRKTVTRRLIKQRNVKITGRPKWGDKSDDGYWFEAVVNYKGRPAATVISIKPPYQPGDILYVRETFDRLPVDLNGNLCVGNEVFYYRADGDLRPAGWQGNWRPSLHMPKEAARIYLLVNEVRVERLQDITEEQAIAEGVADRDAFATLWNSTVEPVNLDMYGWDANPWVWAIQYKRCVCQPGKALA